jgi:hypothetical protein
MDADPDPAFSAVSFRRQQKITFFRSFCFVYYYNTVPVPAEVGTFTSVLRDKLLIQKSKTVEIKFIFRGGGRTLWLYSLVWFVQHSDRNSYTFFYLFLSNFQIIEDILVRCCLITTISRGRDITQIQQVIFLIYSSCYNFRRLINKHLILFCGKSSNFAILPIFTKY